MMLHASEDSTKLMQYYLNAKLLLFSWAQPSKQYGVRREKCIWKYTIYRQLICSAHHRGYILHTQRSKQHRYNQSDVTPASLLWLHLTPLLHPDSDVASHVRTDQYQCRKWNPKSPLSMKSGMASCRKNLEQFSSPSDTTWYAQDLHVSLSNTLTFSVLLFLSLFLFSRWHMLLLHASAEACLTDWPRVYFSMCSTHKKWKRSEIYA